MYLQNDPTKFSPVKNIQSKVNGTVWLRKAELSEHSQGVITVPLLVTDWARDTREELSLLRGLGICHGSAVTIQMAKIHHFKTNSTLINQKQTLFAPSNKIASA
jgi:hypothetical protein